MASVLLPLWETVFLVRLQSGSGCWDLKGPSGQRDIVAAAMATDWQAVRGNFAAGLQSGDQHLGALGLTVPAYAVQQ